jgi:hypothetical protein
MTANTDPDDNADADNADAHPINRLFGPGHNPFAQNTDEDE